jgi:hypothetical protein
LKEITDQVFRVRANLAANIGGWLDEQTRHAFDPALVFIMCVSVSTRLWMDRSSIYGGAFAG